MVLAAGASLDPIQLLLVNAGTAGVVVVLILVGWLWAKPSVIREFEKADAKAKEDKALIESLLASQKEVIPLLIEVDKRVVPLMESTQALLKRVEGLIDRAERDWEYRERRGRVSEETTYGGTRRDLGDRDRGGLREGPGSGDYRPGEERPR
jgi:hypothetical protein